MNKRVEPPAGEWAKRVSTDGLMYVGALKKEHMTHDHRGKIEPGLFLVQCAGSDGTEVSRMKSADKAEALAGALAEAGIRVGITSHDPRVSGAVLWLIDPAQAIQVQGICETIMASVRGKGQTR